MMAGMAYGIFLTVLLMTVLLLGYAYIVWVLAAKEGGTIKTIGQAIAIIIAVLALIFFIYGGIYTPIACRSGCGMYGEGKGMMGKQMMEKMYKSPQMQKMMEGQLKKKK